jgi:DNA-binding XRE family transcriptional regulator
MGLSHRLLSVTESLSCQDSGLRTKSDLFRSQMQSLISIPNPRFVIVSSERLLRLRMQRGMTQLQLAKAAGYTEWLVRKAEKGGRLDIATVQNLAEALSQFGEPVSADSLVVSARRTACCGHGYPLGFSGRVTGGKTLFSRAVGGVGW